MPVSSVQPFSLDHPIDADEYLEALLKNPAFRNIEEVEKRASALIKEDNLRVRFIAKAKIALASQSTSSK